MIAREMPDAEYHARPELSSTGARLLLPEFSGSPAKFKYRQGHDVQSAAFDLGKAVHARVLGVGAQAVAYPSDVLASNGAASTNAAKEWAEAMRAEGFVPMKSAELRPIERMAESVLAHPTARALFELPGGREVSVFGEVDGVRTRARFDALTDETPSGVFGIDLKTAANPVDAESFAREVLKYGYHVQAEWYKDTARADVGDVQFVFVAVETTGPHLVAVHRLDILFEEMGRTLGKVARRTYAECVQAGVWPGHPDDVQTISAPVWAAMAFEERHGTGTEIQVA